MSVEYILAFLNSELCEFYLHNTAALKQGGYYSYSSTAIDTLPFIYDPKKAIEQQGNGYQRKANQIENQIVMKMKDYNDAYNIGFENALTDIESYKQRYHQLKEMDIVSKEEKTRQAKLKCEESFKTSFISGLNEKIENAKKDIAE